MKRKEVRKGKKKERDRERQREREGGKNPRSSRSLSWP